MAMKAELLKILHDPNGNEQLVAWCKRQQSAKVIQLDDFRTDRAHS